MADGTKIYGFCASDWRTASRLSLSELQGNFRFADMHPPGREKKKTGDVKRNVSMLNLIENEFLRYNI